MPKTPSYHDSKINFIINSRGKEFREKYELQNPQYIARMLRPGRPARYNSHVLEFDRSDFPPQILVNPP
jgi:hypothetical protein